MKQNEETKFRNLRLRFNIFTKIINISSLRSHRFICQYAIKNMIYGFETNYLIDGNYFEIELMKQMMLTYEIEHTTI